VRSKSHFQSIAALAARRRELLPSAYLHVIFTLPPQLTSLALQNKTLIYGLLLRASAEALLEVACNGVAVSECKMAANRENTLKYPLCQVLD
jgi:hypothetical protein